MTYTGLQNLLPDQRE